jgi:hypothetical protein
VPSPNGCESNFIAPGYPRQAYGLATRLLRATDPPTSLPAEPDYAVEGIVGTQVPMDEFARNNSAEYARAYRRLAQLYTSAKESERAQRMLQRATEIEEALGLASR